MISVVIPALNEEQLLPDCLKSLKKQKSRSGFEIIVVDNASTDRTSEVARSQGAEVVLCERRGVAFARQAGAEAARGDIVIQVDADTVYPEGWLSRIEDYFATHADAAAVAGRYVYSNPAWWAGIEKAFRRSLNAAGGLLLRWPPSVSGANFAFRKEAFSKAGGYNPASLYPDQWGIAHRLARFGRVGYDHGSVVITSSRRVVKPIHVIAYEIVRNSLHVLGHFVKYLLNKLTLSPERAQR